MTYEQQNATPLRWRMVGEAESKLSAEIKALGDEIHRTAEMRREHELPNDAFAAEFYALDAEIGQAIIKLMGEVKGYLEQRLALYDEGLIKISDSITNRAAEAEAPNCWADSKPLGVNGKVTYETTPEGKAFIDGLVIELEDARRKKEADEQP